MPNRIALDQPYPLTTASDRWWERARTLIPAGTQTLAKGPGQYVLGVAPKYLVRARGARVWDADGNEFLDMNMGIGPLVLGYADRAVDDAIRRQLDDGITFSLMHPLEVELAETLRETIPNAQSVRFAKTGAEATSAAVRVARAFTGRDRVLCCGYHGWHDWYIGVTDRAAGVPAAVRELTNTFAYNDPASLEEGLDHDVAAVILEPMTFEDPRDDFLQRVRDLTERAVERAALPEQLQEPRLRFLEDHRLEDDAGDVVVHRLQEGLGMVVVEGVRLVLHRVGNAGGPVRGADEPVMPAVIAAAQHFAPPRERPGQPHRRAGHVRAGLREPDRLRARDQGADLLRHLDLERVHQRERDPVVELPADRRVDGGVPVAEDQRADPHRQVEVAVAVHVPHVAAPPAPGVFRRDAGDVLTRTLGQGLGAGGDQSPRPRPPGVGFGDEGKAGGFDQGVKHERGPGGVE